MVNNALLKIIVLLVIMAGFLSAQDNILVQVSNEKGYLPLNNIKIPSDSKILLTGYKTPGMKNMTVQVMAGLLEQTVQATLQDSSWVAIVGPFSPRQSVIFNFQSEVILPADSLKNFVTGTFEKIFRQMESLPSETSEEELNILLKKIVFTSIPHELDKYTFQNKVTFSDSLASVILKLGQASILEVFNKCLTLNQKKQSLEKLITKLRVGGEIYKEIVPILKDESSKNLLQLNAKSFEEGEDKKMFNIYQDLAASLDDSLRILKNDINNTITMIQKNQDNMKSLNSDISELQKKVVSLVTEEVIKMENYTTSMTSISRIGGIDFYLGFDVGALYVSDKSFQYMFMVSPSFGKVDINDDPRGFLDYFMLTFGYGLEQKRDKPQYYIGVGSRINKLVRLTLGFSVYKHENYDEYVWMPAFSASINVDYIGSLIGVFNTASEDK